MTLDSNQPKSIPHPDSQFLHWLERNQYLNSAIICGSSLPDIISGLSCLQLFLNITDFDEFRNHLLSGGEIKAIRNFNFEDDLAILDILIDEQCYKCHLYRSNSQNLDPRTLQYNFERCWFRLKEKTWMNADFSSAVFLPDEIEEVVIPNPDSRMDIHRILGLLILTAKMDLPMGEKLQNSMQRHLEEHKPKLEQSDLGEYLLDLISARKPGRAFFMMHELGILEWFLPELDSGFGVEQNKYHKHDVGHHSIHTCDAVHVPDPALRFAALFHDLGKVATRRVNANGEATFHNHELISTRIVRKFFNRTGLIENTELFKRVLFLVRNHMFHYTREWTDKAIRRFVQRINRNQLNDLIELRMADRKGSGKKARLPHAIKELIRHIEAVEQKEQELKVRDLKVSGYDLMQNGIPAGPQMGDILADLLVEVKAGKLENERNNLLYRVEQMLKYESKSPDCVQCGPDTQTGVF